MQYGVLRNAMCCTRSRSYSPEEFFLVLCGCSADETELALHKCTVPHRLAAYLGQFSGPHNFPIGQSKAVVERKTAEGKYNAVESPTEQSH